MSRRTGDRGRDLRVQVRPGCVVLLGRSASDYVKQLAQHGVRDLLPDVGLENAIAVEAAAYLERGLWIHRNRPATETAHTRAAQAPRRVRARRLARRAPVATAGQPALSGGDSKRCIGVRPCPRLVPWVASWEGLV